VHRVTETIGWGILGTGGIANTFATDLINNGMTVAAVGSRSLAAASAFAARHGIPAAHPSYEALVADPTVTAIYVATPHPFHAEHAILALNAGKHVLVEKPFALNATEARDIVALAQSRELIALEAMWTRWLPHIIRLREIIASGTLGEVRTIIADHNQKLSADPANRINAPELGGGALLDLGVYPVSFAWDILGKPSTISAISSPTATGVDRQTAMLFGYPDGQQAVLHTALDTLGPTRAAVIGTLGRVEIDSVFYAPTGFTVYNDRDEVVERFEQAGIRGGKQYEAWEMERLIAGGFTKSAILPPEQSVAIMETLDEIRGLIGLHYPGER
jgi:predicted dehydrogenase